MTEPIVLVAWGLVVGFAALGVVFAAVNLDFAVWRVRRRRRRVVPPQRTAVSIERKDSINLVIWEPTTNLAHTRARVHLTSGGVVFGEARCAPADTFNPRFGRRLALSRAMEKAGLPWDFRVAWRCNNCGKVGDRYSGFRKHCGAVPLQSGTTVATKKWEHGVDSAQETN